MSEDKTMVATMHEGSLDAAPFRFGIVVARFNAFITERLLEGALDCLRRHGANDEHIGIVRVPGTWELPVALSWMVAKEKPNAVIALGTVIRGGTPHFEYVAGEAIKGIAAIAQQTGVPVALGVLTTDTLEQAIERAGTKHGNKGWEAALSAIEMADLGRRMGHTPWAAEGKRAKPRS